jgi:hypothetical protein
VSQDVSFEGMGLYQPDGIYALRLFIPDLTNFNFLVAGACSLMTGFLGGRSASATLFRNASIKSIARERLTGSSSTGIGRLWTFASTSSLTASSNLSSNAP